MGTELTRDPIRVLHLNPSFRLDGPGRGILALMRYLPRERIWSQACSLSPPDPAMESLLRGHGIRHACLEMRGYWDARVLSRLVRILKGQRIEVLHTNLSRADWVGRLAARIAGTPVVVSSIRNLHKEMYRSEYGWLVAAVASGLDRWTSRWADALIALSEDVRQRLVSEGYARDRVVLIPNSVDLDGLDGLHRDAQTKSRLLNLPETAMVVGTVAVFKEQKGYPYLIRAAAHIRRKRKDVYFLVVGAGIKADEIHREIAVRGLESAFRCVGYQQDVTPYLAAMDLFVLPSLWEGMPRALMEAMAAGVPAIGTNVSGIRDLIENGETGILVPPADADSLADAVESVLNDPAGARARSMAAQRRIRERHSAQGSALRYVELYEELLVRSRGIA
jgi:glycosyltransferase involved in cell wall biosynthesis